MLFLLRDGRQPGAPQSHLTLAGLQLAHVGQRHDREKLGKEGEEEFKKQIKDALKEAIDELGLATKADLEKFKLDKN